jgi:chromosome segregation ATPase
MQALVILLAVLAAALTYLFWRSQQKTRELTHRYAAVSDIDAKMASARAELERTVQQSRDYSSDLDRARAVAKQALDAELARTRQAAEHELATLRTTCEADLLQARRRNDEEIAERQRSAQSQLAETQERIAAATRQQSEVEQTIEARREQLQAEYSQALTKYTELKREVSLVEENLEDISFGVYKPHFTFETSDEYRGSWRRSGSISDS